MRGATALLLLMGIVGLMNIVPQTSIATDAAVSHKHNLTKGPLLPTPPSAKPLGQAKNIPDRTKIARTFTPSATVQTDAATGLTVDMKVLVIAADGNEADLPSIQQSLDYLGVPYTLYLAVKTPGGLTADKLTDPTNPSHALYQGVIVTTGDLVYYDSASASWPSALDRSPEVCPNYMLAVTSISSIIAAGVRCPSARCGRSVLYSIRHASITCRASPSDANQC